MNFMLLAIENFHTFYTSSSSCQYGTMYMSPTNGRPLKKSVHNSSLLKVTTNFVIHFKMQISHFLDKLAEMLFAE